MQVFYQKDAPTGQLTHTDITNYQATEHLVEKALKAITNMLNNPSVSIQNLSVVTYNTADDILLDNNRIKSEFSS